MAGALAALSTFVVQKLIRTGWKQITGQEPPDPDDPEVFDRWQRVVGCREAAWRQPQVLARRHRRQPLRSAWSKADPHPVSPARQ